MFDTTWVADLDADAACEAVLTTQADLREHEWRELVLAAHWAVLHGRDTDPGAGDVLAGHERWVPAGAPGTPQISEFACAELGLVMGSGFIAAAALIRDAVDLQHRHPRLWAALGAGKGRVWKARQVAKMTGAAGLTRDQARFVDAATTAYLDTLTWSAFIRLVEAKIIEADPAAAEARRLAAAMARFVSTGATTEHGLRTLIARAGAGEVIYFVAVCDRIAQILALEGDPDPVDVRRSKALAILANPARALDLLARHASPAPHPDDPDQSPTDTEPHPDPAASTDSGTDPGTGTGSGTGTEAATGTGTCRSCGGSRIDSDKLRPRAVLYVRISEHALATRTGVAHCESGIGPLPLPGLRDLLGHHHVTVRPVLDLAGQVPVEAYEVPHAMREALRLARPTSVFPWTRSGTSTPDLDHTRPYLPPDHGGPPGQTRVGNLGPLVRFAHRVKTHGHGWRHHQPRPGTYLWRTPHGYWYRVDNDGTHPLGKDPDPVGRDPVTEALAGAMETFAPSVADGLRSAAPATAATAAPSAS